MTAHCVLILGGSGTLGGPLSLRAAAQGWDVIVTYHTQPDRIRAGLPVRLDLRDYHALSDLVASVQPNAIIHTAITERSGDGYTGAIRTAGAHVAKIAATHAIRLIALSTDLVFDGTAARYDEDSPPVPHPASDYGRAKASMERDILSRCPSALVVRTSLIYDFDPANAQVAWMLRALAHGETLRLFTDQWRCPIWVWNLADALLELTTQPDLSGLLHVVGPALVSRYNLGVALLDALGHDTAQVEPASAPDSAPRSLDLSVDRARSVLQHTSLLTLAEARAAWESQKEQ